MKIPSLREYKAAISDTKNINIPFFKSSSIQIFLNQQGTPYMSVGGFGAVFKFKDKNDNKYALKVFTRDSHDRGKRYKALHDTLQITKFPFMVDFYYVEEGIKVGKTMYPIVVMQWGHGLTLDKAIENDLHDDGKFQSAPTIAGNIFQIAKTLQEWNMGHGDFQEGNFLVGNNDHVTLIDYDGMYVPTLEGERANEIGLADYQHPKRNNDVFGSRIDDFSLLSILLQLSMITPAAWKEYHSDKRLLLTKKDYTDPRTSQLIQKGLDSKKKHIRALAGILLESFNLRPLEIRAVEKIRNENAIMDWLVLTSETKPVENYTSIISQVVSLTDEQVIQFESNALSIALPPGIPGEAAGENIHKIRKFEDNGSWEKIINFFYEEDKDTNESNENTPGNNEQGTGEILRRATSKVMDILFEEVNEENEESPAAPQAGAGPPLPITPVAGSGNPNKEIHSSNKYDEKTAPVPDWMKKRKGKY